MALTNDAHRLIFCMNSGRAGSKYLSKVLGSAKQVRSFHEADPTMSGEYLHWINHKPYAETFAMRQCKAIALRKLLDDLPSQAIYCETNHMFIKTFFDVVVDAFGAQIEVILLRRNLASVLKSFLELGYFSDQNEVWPNWMSSPNAVTAAIPCIDADDHLDPCDRSIAYLIDIEARALRFCQDYPHIKVHPVRLESFSRFEYVMQVFDQLRLIPTDKTRELAQKTFNTKEKRKQQINQTVDLHDCQARIHHYIERATAQGIQCPNTLALE